MLKTLGQLYNDRLIKGGEGSGRYPKGSGKEEEKGQTDKDFERAEALFSKHSEDIDMLKWKEKRIYDKVFGKEDWNSLSARQQAMRWKKFEQEMQYELSRSPEVARMREAGIEVTHPKGKEHFDISVPPLKEEK
jgi:hypothetical protein